MHVRIAAFVFVATTKKQSGHGETICDWLWENQPLTHKVNYPEKRDCIIQSVISPEGLKLQACNLQHSYIAI